MICPHCADWEARYHELVKETLSMKREGFSVPRETGEPVVVPELPVVIQEAIGKVCKVGSLVWADQTKLAWAELRIGKDKETIAADILAGEKEPW